MTMQSVEQFMTAPSVGYAGRVGQGTVVEQSRAAEEVRALVVVARQFPRVEPLAIERLRQTCRHEALAKRAFFSYPKGRGQAVTGPTVHLARELARCWGNVTFGLTELRRDDEYRQSEMQAWAWDLETNQRVSTTFIVPHAMDTKNGVKDLEDLRSVYENNANMGARRLREQIFSVLPVWYTEMGKELCTETLKNGGGVPLPQRIANVVAGFACGGVTTDQLERNRGRKMTSWTDMDVAQLDILFMSLTRGEVTKEEAFPEERVTVEELARTQPAPVVVDVPLPEDEGDADPWQDGAAGSWPEQPGSGQ